MTVKILIVIAIIIVIPFIIALFAKKEFAIEKEVVINKPKQEVFTYVKFLKNQDHYNKWTMMDADLKKEFKGTDGTFGFVYGWDGKKAGKGEQELKKITEGERIDLELRFMKPFESMAAAYLTTDPVSANQTRVKWGMNGVTPYPRNFMNLFMNNFLGKALQENLLNLKAILEKK
jgi:uncharacterized protein YndB with AHSA1/START domain